MSYPATHLPISLISIACLIVCIWCFAYVVDRTLGKKFPWYVNIVGGILTAPFVWCVAIVCFVLDVIGVRYPLIK